MVPNQRDYYSILGMSKNCNESEIKKSYYKLAKKWHPDKNSSPLAEDKFKEINKAYEVLSDEKKRSVYDSQHVSEILIRSSFSSKTRSTYTPRSSNFTFNTTSSFTNTTNTNNNNNNNNNNTTNTKSSYKPGETYTATPDSKWRQFTNSKPSTAPPAGDANKPNEEEKAKTPKPNINRESFYKGFKKYFESDYDNNSDSDSVIIEDFYNELKNSKPTNEPKPFGKSNSNANSSAKAKWSKTWSTPPSSFKAANPKTETKNPTENFKFNSKSDPFELLETFAMYKLFSEMSNRLFDDVNDEEMLINLAKIISSFNLSDKTKIDLSKLSSGSFRKTATPTKDPASDFVFEDKSNKGAEQAKPSFDKLPKKSVHSTASTPPPPAETKPEWEFEWLGKKGAKEEEGAADESTLPSYGRAGSVEAEDDDLGYLNDEDDDLTANYANYDDLFDLNSIYNSKYFECRYCYKKMSDKEDLLSHQSLCKRLSQNRLKSKYFSSKYSTPPEYYTGPRKPTTATSTTHPLTECAKCKTSMSTYDYLLHQCGDSNRFEHTSSSATSSSNSNFSSSSFKYKDLYRNVNAKPAVSVTAAYRSGARHSYDSTMPAANKSCNLRSSYSTSSKAGSPLLNNNANSQSDFVFAKMRTPLSANKKTDSPKHASATTSQQYSPKRSAKLVDTENNQPNKAVIKPTSPYANINNSNSNAAANAKSSNVYNSATYGGLDSQYTSAAYRPQQQTSSTSFGNYSKPYSPYSNSSYSKSSRLANTSYSALAGSKYYPFNSSYTGIKREKLRTGF